MPAAPGKAKEGGWWRPLILLIALFDILILARIFGLGDKLEALRGWMESLGPWGPLAFVLIYIAAVVAALPGSAVTMAAGALFGSVVGVTLVSIGSTVGASLAFLISRYFARDAVINWLSGSEKFQKLDKLTQEHGAFMVAFTRLVPIFPFNLLNYGFGLTRVPFWTYVFWSWLCMLLATVLHVVGADTVSKSLSRGRVLWGLIGAAVGLVVVRVVLGTVARNKMQARKMKLKVPVPPALHLAIPVIPEMQPPDDYNLELVANVHPPDRVWESWRMLSTPTPHRPSPSVKLATSRIALDSPHA